MDDTDQNFCIDYRPTRSERIAKWLGYGPVGIVEIHVIPSHLDSWLRGRVYMRLSLGDRVRLLFTGRLEVMTLTHTDVQVSEAVTESRIIIPAPWEKKR